MAAAGAVGVVLAADSETRSRRAAAQALADSTAAGVEARLLQLAAPVLALAAVIRAAPDYLRLAAQFPDIARDLVQPARASGTPKGEGRLNDLRLEPQGVLRAIEPARVAYRDAIGLDILADPWRRPAAIEAMKNVRLSVQGPRWLQPERFYGLVMRVPVFIPNVTNPRETFGAPTTATDCPEPICYDPATKTRFWGFAVAAAHFEFFAGNESAPAGGGGHHVAHSLLGALRSQGHDYALIVPQPQGGPPVRVSPSGPGPLAAPVASAIVLPASGDRDSWQLELSPRAGWAPLWRAPLVALAVAASALLGALLLWMLVARQQQLWLLDELRDNNGKLADEKRRTDALVQRQLQLIHLLVDQQRAAATAALPLAPPVSVAGPLKGGRAPDAAGRLDTLDSARERIEELRRTVGTGAAPQEEPLQLLELLGEGAFGKVYKGVWRGTTVAVKKMVLPAKMSGAEKHERMAIVEAAISSAMCHPNIVQTYTYTIRPIGPSPADAQRNSGVVRLAIPEPGTSSQGGLLPLGGQERSEDVTNFEVCLVLEFCELGSLRDALNGGAFRLGGGGGINYAAVLDTTADIARALLHLHKQHVLHSDLKACNVLLRGDYKSGRAAVAKVADFGLALQIDPNTTHISQYQGTPTHMPPEALRHGRVSKAGDVFSFGITLYELYTGSHVHRGVPVAALSYRVSAEGLRPVFPSSTPADFRELAAACWAADPDARPTFEEIVPKVLAMRQALGGKTPRLRTVRRSYTASYAYLDPAQQPACVGDDNADARRRHLLVGETIGEADTALAAQTPPSLPPPLVHLEGGHDWDHGAGGGSPASGGHWVAREHPEGPGAAADSPDGAGLVNSFAASFFAKRRNGRRRVSNLAPTAELEPHSAAAAPPCTGGRDGGARADGAPTPFLAADDRGFVV